LFLLRKAARDERFWANSDENQFLCWADFGLVAGGCAGMKIFFFSVENARIIRALAKALLVKGPGIGKNCKLAIFLIG
jgi:hypothetical protein